jgi:hypothetical protein
LRKPDTSNVKRGVKAAVKAHSKAQSYLSSNAQPQDQAGWQLQLDLVGEKLWQKVVSQILVSVGVNVIAELQNTSKEGKMGAAALGGVAAAASLADGQIDRLEVLGIVAATWIGTKMGEALTPAERFYKQGIDNEREGNYSEAIINFNKVISKDKNYCGAYFHRAVSMLKSVKLRKQIRILVVLYYCHQTI